MKDMSLFFFVFLRAPERAVKEIYLELGKRASSGIVTFNAFRFPAWIVFKIEKYLWEN